MVRWHLPDFMPKKLKKPVAFGGIPNGEKKPREESAVDHKPVWRFAKIDFGGPWCPTCLDKEKLLEVITKFGQLETQTFTELKRRGCHVVETHKLIKAARERLIALKLDDIGALYSIRLTGRNRIWGLMVGHVITPLWWDAEHKICPSPLKNT